MHLRRLAAVVLLTTATGAALLPGGGTRACRTSPVSLRTRYRSSAVRLQQAFPGDDDGGDGGQDREGVSDDERGDVDAARAMLMRQFLGDADPAAEDNPVDALLSNAGVPVAPPVRRMNQIATGQMLVANPERFCSRNPFSQPVKELGRFGLQGPIDLGQLDPDTAAQMLPVLLLTEHSDGGSRALLMERRTGALMGDVSMEDYGCVAISPLWLGGTSRQNSLYVVHDVDSLVGANEVRDGLYLGGWSDARPKVADSTLAEGRFKFFLGATEWSAGQLQDEFNAGAWIALDCEPSLVIKDRVSSWRPGKPKPVWTELMRALGEEGDSIVGKVYPK